MVLTVAAQLLNDLDLRGVASSALRDLAAEIGHTVHLATWDRGEVVYLDKVETGEWTRTSTNIGRRNPAHCTSSGKAMLAYLPEDAFREVLAHGLTARSSNTITTERGLREALRDVRTRGYAIDDREISEQSRGVAAPIFDYRGRVVGAVAVADLETALTLERVEELGARVVQTAQAISARLGYQG